MPTSQTLTGGCHCGLVRFECTTMTPIDGRNR
jgi:hypothetical protein